MDVVLQGNDHIHLSCPSRVVSTDTKTYFDIHKALVYISIRFSCLILQRKETSKFTK